MTDQTAETQRLIQSFNNEAQAYWRQFHLWLGIGSAGGAISLVSLASSLPDPVFAFNLFLLSFWFFLVGVVASGASLVCLAKRAEKKADHFACAHNRDQLSNSIKATPEVISSPHSLADEMNSGRNQEIAKHDKWHEKAERAWKSQNVWYWLWGICLAGSGLGFVGGFIWALYRVSHCGLLPVG